MKKKDTPDRISQQQQLELQAIEHVVPWTELVRTDYDFRSWAGRSEELLRAGWAYEYARESHRLRCLLVLVKPAEQSQPFDVLSWSFEGLRYKDALLHLGGWFGWLRLFTDQLADNTSFAELCDKAEKQISDSLDTLHKFFHEPKAIEIASPNLTESLIEPRLLWPSQQPDAPYRNIENDVTLTIRVRLRDFTNKEIGREMENFASMLRPSTEKEPTRQGTRKSDSPRSWLDALSAMRLASWYAKSRPQVSIRKSRKCVDRTAIEIFREVQLGRMKLGSAKRKLTGELAQNDFDRHAARARRLFAEMFPFGDDAANAVTCAQRHRKKR